MIRTLSRRIKNARIVPGTFPYGVVFAISRVLCRVGLLRPNGKIEVLHAQGGDIVLVPLSGSSSVRRGAGLPVRYHLRPGQPTYCLVRDDGLRAQSFYNKKLRNPDTVAKCAVLATCPPLRHSDSVEDFLGFLASAPPRAKRDKHLWAQAEVLAHYGLTVQTAILLEIGRDKDRIEKLIGKPIGERVNSSDAVATFQSPVAFDDDQIARARLAFGKMR